MNCTSFNGTIKENLILFLIYYFSFGTVFAVIAFI